MAKRVKSPSTSTKPKSKKPVEVTVVVDLVIRVHQEHVTKPVRNSLMSLDTLGAGGCPDNKFSYSFDKEKATVLSLSVEDYINNEPGDSGNFTTCINDASEEPKVRVICSAKEDTPGGRVALTLKFLGKDVFATPKELKKGKEGYLELNTLAKLP